MIKEFDVKDKINFPENIFIKSINDYIVVLAPDYPNWIVLNEEEHNLFELLRQNCILESIIRFNELYINNEEKSLEVLNQLLAKIESSKFYLDSNIRIEEPIEAIKKNVQINIISDCNLRCKHCYLSAGVGEPVELKYEEIECFINEMTKEIELSEIVISGGEPLLHKDIIKILKLCKDKGHRVILFTNGILINEKNIIKIAEYVDEIQISMEGISKSSFEYIRGKHTYDKLIENLILIKKYNIFLTMAITVLDEVIDDIDKNLCEFLLKLNYKNMNVRINDEVEFKGNAINLKKTNFNYYYDKKIRVNSIMERLDHIGFGIEFEENRNIKYSNCGIGTSIVLNYDRKVYPCNEFGKIYMNIDDPMKKIINFFHYLNKSTTIENINLCKKCELKYICNAGCRVKNHYSNGDLIKPICNNEYKEKKYYDLIESYLKA